LQIKKKLAHHNLSRKNTPGSLFSAFSDDQDGIFSHQNEMHKEKSPAGWRDPDGHQHVYQQRYEENIDKTAKLAGVVLEGMKNHDVVFGISRLLTEPVLHAKQMYAKHTRGKIAWGFLGGVKGLGIGLWKVSSSVPHAAFSFMKWTYKKITQKKKEENLSENPLAIPSAHTNEPSLKVKWSMETRDFLLDLLNRPVTIDLKAELLDRLNKRVSVLYPDMPAAEKEQFINNIKSRFPEFDPGSLFDPFSQWQRTSLMKKHRQVINVSLIQAIYAAVTDPNAAGHLKKLIKHYYEFFGLNPSQKDALTDFVNYYFDQKDKNIKNRFLDLFKHGGKFQQALDRRDSIIHKIQNWNNTIFDPENFGNKKPADEKIYFSKKDQADRKWAAFVEREFKHELMTESEVENLFENINHLLETADELKQQLSTLQSVYSIQFQEAKKVSNSDLDYFYKNTNELIQKMDLFPDAKKLLQNFLDVTMNAVVNARLDNIDIFEKQSEIPNPLLRSEAIKQWLNELKKDNKVTRHLLDQQLQQSPSVDHAVWRDQCILQVLELDNSGRVHKTGMQQLLRFWIQHAENVKRTGQTYVDENLEPKKVLFTSRLFAGSQTMQHALERVTTKVVTPLREYK